MTIKKNGGIFGRNPSFNDVETGNLSVASLTNDKLLVAGSSGELESASGLNYNGSSFSVDATTYLGGDKYLRDGSVYINNDGTGGVNVEIGDTDDAALVRLMRNGPNYIDMPASNGSLIFRTQSGFTSRLTLATGGDVTLHTGNLVIGTAGKGIDFSATAGTGTSELLDDYEEGTWTATVGCTGNATTTTTIAGYYTKIGRQVTVGFRNMNNIVTTGLNGFFTISLPFTANSGSTFGATGACVWDSLNFPAGYTQISPSTSTSGTNLLFSFSGTGAADSFLGATAPTSGVADIAFLTLTYFTD